MEARAGCKRVVNSNFGRHSRTLAQVTLTEAPRSSHFVFAETCEIMVMLFELEDADYEPLTSFSLLWRWTSPRYTELPTDVLESIRPIARRKAALINDYARKRVHSERAALGLKAEAVRDVQVIYADDADQSVVREWLRSLPIPVDETVIVSWNRDTAVTAPFAVVAEYWSDFFYLSSDDAAIVAPSVGWMLIWNHDGTFQFGIASPQPGEAG